MSAGTLVVGGGLAAQRCVETLRGRGFDEPITIVGGELEFPYDRPPLSKGLLAGDLEKADVRFREPSWYADNRVELLLGTRASALEPRARTVELEDGRRLRYDRLLIATGAQARTLPMLRGYANAYTLRTIDDARRLRRELAPGARLVIVGAGFIGQEVAATATAAGVEVTIVEALPLPLAAALGEDVGRWLVALHVDSGARVRLSAKLTGARGNGRVQELSLESGERLECDAVVVGVGVSPSAGWLDGSGLGADGVCTDHAGRTAIPGVYAAGDVARTFDPRLGRYVRTEHWDAAARQGVAAARAMLGEQPPARALSSFWSDQYGLRIQYVGDSSGADRIAVDGDPSRHDFSVLYSEGDRPVAGLAVGRPRELVAMRRLIESFQTQSNQAKEAVV